MVKKIVIFVFLLCAAIYGQAQFPFRADTVQFEKVDIPALENRHKQILIDERGVLWLGEKGLFRYFGKSSDHYPLQQENSIYSISNACIGLSNLTRDHISITFGGSGVLLINTTTGLSEFINPAENTGSIFHNRIHHGEMPVFNNDSLLIISDGFTYYDLTEKKLTPFINFDEKVKYWTNSTTSFIQHPTKKDLAWIYRDKLYLINYETGELIFTAKETSKINPSKSSGFNNKFIITGDKSGMLIYNTDNDSWEQFLYEENKVILGKNNCINDHKYIGDSIFIFAGAREAGLFDYKTKSFSFFKFPLVVPEGHNVFFISTAIDNQGVIWCSSWLGLFKSKHPIFDRKKDPELIITSLRCGRELNELIYPIPSKDKHLIRQNDNLDIKFELANPAFPKKVQYSYKLKNFDKKWSLPSNTSQTYYTNLPPGNYSFLIKAVDYDGKEYTTTIDNLVVEGFFFQTLYFKLLMLLISLGLLAWIYIIRVNKIRYEERLKIQYENKLVELEMLALRSQMNPHFIFNSMNSIKSYLINKGQDEAIDYLTKFSVLMRTILENSKKELLSLGQEIKGLELYIAMENKRLQSPFEFELEIDDDLDLYESKIPPMILQPHIENAIWHGLMPKKEDRRLLLKFVKTEQGFLCIIEDNGVGRAYSKEMKNGNLHIKTSLGTSITNNRIETFNKMHNSNIRVEVIDLKNQDKPIGTRIMIFVELSTVK